MPNRTAKLLSKKQIAVQSPGPTGGKSQRLKFAIYWPHMRCNYNNNDDNNNNNNNNQTNDYNHYKL